MKTQRTIILTGLLFSLLVCAPLIADEIYLKDGRKIQGQVRADKNGFITVERTYGMLKIDKKKIVKVVKTDDMFDRFDALAGQAKSDSSKLMQLAIWCKSKGLNHRMREAARKLIATDNDHAGARKLLRQVKFGDKWVSQSTAFAKEGRVKRGGKWLSADNSNQLRHAKIERIRMKKLQRRMNTYVRRIYSRNAKSSERAYVQLLSFGKKEKIKGLRPVAATFYRDAAVQRAALASVTATVRLQQSSLTSLRERSLSLGTGGNVRIQLPETKLVGISSTVGIPLR
ncbi:MAG: hypothetical protein ACI97A_002167 [Planctomycetota bacterium]|jgi:hypothetical protein